MTSDICAPSLPVLLVVGCGYMGSAVLRSALRARICRAAVVDPNAASSDEPGREGLTDGPFQDMAAFFASEGGGRHDYVLFGVKPQELDPVLRDYRRLAEAHGGVKPALSMAAGAALSYFKARLGADAQTARFMPNIAARLGAGSGAGFVDPACTPETRAFALRLFAAAGCAAEVTEEPLLDAVTALSGSGPAYFFYLAECMTEAAKRAGLPAEDAARLAAETLAGAGALAEEAARAGVSLAELRRQVTSKGGVTAAAIEAFSAPPGLSALTLDAMNAALARAKDLAVN